MNPAPGVSATVSDAERRGFLRRALIKHCVMGIVLASIFRLISGRADWFRAWFYIGLTLVLLLAVTVTLHRLNPELLVERARIQKGTKPWDKLLAPGVGIIGPVAIWCVAAVDVRAHWPPAVPVVWSVGAFVVCMLGILLTFRAMTANRFFSATVRIQTERGHVVVDRGPYRYVRHPGYSGALAFTVASPVALGSWLALIPAGLTALALAIRTALEDRTLSLELDGYRDYQARVRNRLVPGLW